MSEKARSYAIGINFTEGSIFKKLVIYVLPLLLSNFLQQLYNAADTLVIGQFHGSVGTVGVSAGGEIAALVTFVAIAFSGAGQIYTSQLCGAGSESKIKETTGTLISFTLGLSVVFMIVSTAFCDQLLRLINTPTEAFSEARSYMLIVNLGLPAVFGYNGVCGLLRGMGESKRPLIFIVISSITNMVLNVFLLLWSSLGQQALP